MNLKKSLPDLERYFSEVGNSPETINHAIKRAALLVATSCAHTEGLEAEDIEKIAFPLTYLSEIIDIIDRYEDEKLGDDNNKA